MSELNKNLETKTVEDLLSLNFYIRSYQRGYRWNDQQVLNLLNDIHDFSKQRKSENDEKSPWYCLQPLVVKEMAVKEMVIQDMTDKQKEELLLSDELCYEVIDGQQRLTTIFLIVHYANDKWGGTAKQSEPTIQYETRPKSAIFLKEISVGRDNKVKIDDSNIDYNHISKAYATIHKWAEERMKEEGFDREKFQDTLYKFTKVIWYEVAKTEDSRDVFTRLNMGKIRLTNAELIKALLLSKDSIDNANQEELRLKRLGIATEWDTIERQLNNPDFWYFITNKKPSEYSTKIELLLELSMPDAKMDDEFGVFNHFSDLWNNKDNKVKKISWEYIVANFELLRGWYKDPVLYHKIGYLIIQDSTLKMLSGLLKLSKDMTKDDFASKLDDKIIESLSKINIDELMYNKDNTNIHKVLTLFNIVTVMNTNDSMHRYPFRLHKEECWSLEHIHAQQSEGLNTVEAWESWLKSHSAELKKSNDTLWTGLAEKIDGTLKQPDKITKEVFDKYFEDVKNVMTKDDNSDEVHGLENMALLGKNNNSSLNNSMFAVKRSKIIEMDKKGSYIPICTRNVFLKYYNEDVKDFVFWSPQDRTAYLKAINEKLEGYLPTSNSSNQS